MSQEVEDVDGEVGLHLADGRARSFCLFCMFLETDRIVTTEGVTLRDRFRSNHALHATAEVEPIPTWLNERWDIQDSPDPM